MEQKNDLRVVKVSRVSKNGNPYQALVIIYKGYKKIVLMSQAEQFLYSDVPVTNLED